MIAPPEASTIAGEVDALVLLLLAVSLLIAGSIFVLIVVFCAKYRRRPDRDIGEIVGRTAPIEFAWITVPAILALVPFVWGAKIYLQEAVPPADALEIYVVAKQWMWKAEQPGGQSEIDAVHVPTGRPVKLTMTSQDVIHSLYVPAFRVKADVLPGRYTTLWFQATQPGTYPLECTQYCGTDHAVMIGQVVAMTPGDYAAWLTGGAGADNSPAARGRKVFLQYGCVECHETGRAPNLNGLFGQRVQLSDGSFVVADEAYLRQLILTSDRVPVGYQHDMPAFGGIVSEEDVSLVVTYIRSIGPGGAIPQSPPPILPVPAPSPAGAVGGST